MCSIIGINGQNVNNRLFKMLNILKHSRRNCEISNINSQKQVKQADFGVIITEMLREIIKNLKKCLKCG